MIELVDRADIIPVRHIVLRPNLPVETALYPEDDTPGIFHLASRAADGTVLACVTFFPDPLDGDGQAWRFRGMATLPAHRGKGIGGELLEAGLAHVEHRGGTRVWCNGRSTATAFYLRHGFITVGEEFSLPPHNHPHYVFVRDLRTA